LILSASQWQKGLFIRSSELAVSSNSGLGT
jgi:hypothetical protein